MEEVWSYLAPAEQVAKSGVEATTYNQEIGLVLCHERQYEFVECRSVFGVAHSSMSPSHIEIETPCFTGSTLMRGAGVGKESFLLIVSMDVDAEDVFAVNGCLGSSVTARIRITTVSERRFVVGISVDSIQGAEQTYPS
jgi:hypothetical protein